MRGPRSARAISTFARADYKQDWPHNTEVLFPTSDAFAQAEPDVQSALQDGLDAVSAHSSERADVMAAEDDLAWIAAAAAEYRASGVPTV